MWHAFCDFVLKLHAQGLGHEAAIEIMIALLGVMLTVAALLVAFVSWLGYAEIKKAAVKQARKEARKIAKEAALNLYRAWLDEENAAEYTESQKDLGESKIETPRTQPKQARKQKATSDSNLKRRNRREDDTGTSKNH